MTTGSIEERLEAYSPRGLSSREWELCRDVVLAAVQACSLRDASHARTLASQLCMFLSRLPVKTWDRQQVPDLAVLLSDEAIVAASKSRRLRATANSRVAMRQYLREVARAVTGQVRRPLHAPVTAPKRASAFWPAVALSGPVTVLAAGYAQRGGTMFQQTWNGLADDLVIDLAAVTGRDDQVIVIAKTTANTGVPGNVVGVKACVAALRDATDVPMEVSPANGSSTSVAGATASRPMSKTARLRAAKEALAARAAAELEAVDPRPAQVADLPVLAADIAAAIASYRPLSISQGDWDRVAVAARAGMTAYRPTSAKEAASKGSWIAKYGAWLLHRPERLETARDLQAVELLDAALVEHYFGTVLADQPRASRATARAILRRVVANLSEQGRTERLQYTPVQPPYTLIECDRLRQQARTQPTVAGRRSLSAVVALCLGAGLSSEESKAVTPEQVRTVDLGEHGTAVVVDVLGRTARTAVVRAEYADLLLEAVAIHHRQRRGAEMPLYGRDPKRRASVSRVAADARTASGKGIEANGARMRSTWLVAVMSAPVPLGALLAASGLRTARTIADLLPYCPTPAPEQVAALLAGLADVEPRESA